MQKALLFFAVFALPALSLTRFPETNACLQETCRPPAVIAKDACRLPYLEARHAFNDQRQVVMNFPQHPRQACAPLPPEETDPKKAKKKMTAAEKWLAKEEKKKQPNAVCISLMREHLDAWYYELEKLSNAERRYTEARMEYNQCSRDVEDERRDCHAYCSRFSTNKKKK